MILIGDSKRRYFYFLPIRKPRFDTKFVMAHILGIFSHFLILAGGFPLSRRSEVAIAN